MRYILTFVVLFIYTLLLLCSHTFNLEEAVGEEERDKYRKRVNLAAKLNSITIFGLIISIILCIWGVI